MSSGRMSAVLKVHWMEFDGRALWLQPCADTSDRPRAGLAPLTYTSQFSALRARYRSRASQSSPALAKNRQKCLFLPFGHATAPPGEVACQIFGLLRFVCCMSPFKIELIWPGCKLKVGQCLAAALIAPGQSGFLPTSCTTWPSPVWPVPSLTGRSFSSASRNFSPVSSASRRSMFIISASFGGPPVPRPICSGV